ncbi:MAG: hypothetical protein EPN62_00755 [Candidimonas sp.]|nr:MAG: hypothetical protein EPN77_01755 [Candidimonas sp.]TAM26860.1 MAG: hypothetical protein EPN62_00755 [Candidimonas sp.]
MKNLISLLALLFCAQVWAVTMHELPPPNVQKVIDQYWVQNEICRDTSPDTPEREAKMNAGCNKRESIYKKIEATGWCYGSTDPDAATYQYQWMKCSKTARYSSQAISSKSKDASHDALTKKNMYCQKMGELVNHSVALRNAGISPEKALSDTNMMGTKTLSLKTRKETINSVYFNREFANLSEGVGVVSAIYDSCMRDWKPRYEPLK